MKLGELISQLETAMGSGVMNPKVLEREVLIFDSARGASRDFYVNGDDSEWIAEENDDPASSIYLVVN